MIGREYRLTRDMEQATKAFGLEFAPQSINLRPSYADAPGQATFVWNMGYQARDAAEEIDTLFRHLLPDAASDKVVAMRKGKGTIATNS